MTQETNIEALSLREQLEKLKALLGDFKDCRGDKGWKCRQVRDDFAGFYVYLKGYYAKDAEALDYINGIVKRDGNN